jgi:hypothetical protein
MQDGDLMQAGAPRSLERTGTIHLERATPYNQPEDWVFASTRMKGKQPYSPDSLLKRPIRSAVKREQILKPCRQMRLSSAAASASTGAWKTACTGAWTWPLATTRCGPAPALPHTTWPCSNTSPSTSSDSTRPNEKAESKPDDSSPPPAMTTVLNSSDSSDVHCPGFRTGWIMGV